MTADDGREGQNAPQENDHELVLTKDFVEHALYQFPSEAERLNLKPRRPRDARFEGGRGASFFERHRARWTVRAEQQEDAPPGLDLSELLAHPDRRNHRRALTAAAAVGACACVIALVVGRSLSLGTPVSHDTPRLVYASDVAAGRVEAPSPPLPPSPESAPLEPELSPPAPALVDATLRVPAHLAPQTRSTRATADTEPVARPAAYVTTIASRAAEDPVPAFPSPSETGTPELAFGSAAALPIPRTAPPGEPTPANAVPAATVSAAPAAPVVTIPDERQVIHQVLGRYQAAFNRLDAGAAAAVWPHVDRRALERGFNQLESQTVTLKSCSVNVLQSRATATCQGQTVYVPKVGNRSERTENRTWTFDLQKSGEHWLIARVDSR